MIRLVKLEDAFSVQKIYSHYVAFTTISFELSPPSIEEIEQRIKNIVQNYPWIVYEENKKILGYAYATRFKERKAYDFTAEISVYIDKDFTGKGLGTLLYQNLIEKLKITQIAVLIGGIALPNEKSVRLHESFGFKNAGILKNVGRKFGKWIDVGYWQLEIKNLNQIKFHT